MEKEITVQIHDYDGLGNYHIVDEKKLTKDETILLRSTARSSVKVDWSKLPKEATHIVYYAELINKDGEVWFAAAYMHGEAYDDKEFERIFNQEEIGYVGAIHKHYPIFDNK